MTGSPLGLRIQKCEAILQPLVWSVDLSLDTDPVDDTGGLSMCLTEV